MTPLQKREAAWNRIEKMVDRSRLKSLSREIGLEDAIAAATEVLAGKVTGRLVVNPALALEDFNVLSRRLTVDYRNYGNSMKG